MIRKDREQYVRQSIERRASSRDLRSRLRRLAAASILFIAASLSAMAQERAPRGTIDLDAAPRGATLRSAAELFNRSIEQRGGSAFSLAEEQPGDENWDARFAIPGVDGVVYAILSVGSDLYVGGQFTSAGGVMANNIARWDGRRWWPLISNGWNGTDGDVLSLALYRGKLVVGGQFFILGGAEIKGIASWDPAAASWSAFGEGIEGDQFAYVATIVTRGDDMYVGGRFNSAGAALAINVARWDGTKWNRMSSGMNEWVYTLAFHNDVLYAGGRFTIASGDSANYIAQWDGTQWRALGAGVNRPVHALTATAEYLYVGGTFDSAGSRRAIGIARWKPSTTTWESVPGGISEGSPRTFVYGLATRGTDVVVGGHFRNAGGNQTNHLALFREPGNRWESIDTGVKNEWSHLTPFVSTIHVTPNSIYLGGNFLYINSAWGSGILEDITYLARSLARVDGKWLAAVGGGVNGSVATITVDGDDVYVGGGFKSARDLAARNVARWNSSTDVWSALDTGLPFSPFREIIVSRLAILGDDIFVATMDALYRFRKSTGKWTRLATVDGITALTVHGSDLYIGLTNGIRRWNGGATASEWESLGIGVNGAVQAITSAGDDIYVGGSFTKAGPDSAVGIARWHVPTRTWHALGRGVPGTVMAIAVRGTEVYAGGSFARAGTTEANNVAVWITEDQEWYPLDEGLDGQVWSIATTNTAVYVTGRFNRSGTLSLRNIARWTGESWATLGSGLNSLGRVVVTRGEDVFVGGDFDSAGVLSSYGFAHWNRTVAGVKEGAVTGTTAMAISSTVYPNPFRGTARIMLDLRRAGRTTVEIFNAQGRSIAMLLEKSLPAGEHEFEWRAGDLPEGVYFCRITSGASVTSMPLVLVR